MLFVEYPPCTTARELKSGWKHITLPTQIGIYEMSGLG
jgi:hypothetical protein